MSLLYCVEWNENKKKNETCNEMDKIIKLIIIISWQNFMFGCLGGINWIINRYYLVLYEKMDKCREIKDDDKYTLNKKNCNPLDHSIQNNNIVFHLPTELC